MNGLQVVFAARGSFSTTDAQFSENFVNCPVPNQAGFSHTADTAFLGQD